MNYYETAQESTYFNTNPDPDYGYNPNPGFNSFNQPVYSNPTQPAYDASFDRQFLSSAAEEPAVPETVESSLFVPGFLQTQVGKLMRIEFLVGNTVQDRVGILRQVGASYILIQPVGETSMIMCDLFSIRFATIVNRPINGESVIIT